MDIHQLIELFFGRPMKDCMDADPGIIDQKIEIIPLPVIRAHPSPVSANALNDLWSPTSSWRATALRPIL